MAQIVNANSFGKKLCRVLGLDEAQVSSITISVVAGDVVRVGTVLQVDTPDGILEVLKDYTLVEKDEQQKED